MKALSVRQPWAELIVRGIKDVENRTWTRRYRGPLLIHAGKKMDDRDETRCLMESHKLSNLVFGAIIGQVVVEGVSWNVFEGDGYLFRPSIWADEGFYGWAFSHAEKFTAAYPYKGRQGLFEVGLEALRAK